MKRRNPADLRSAKRGSRTTKRNPARDYAWLRWFNTLDAEGAIEALDPYGNRDPSDVLAEARRIKASPEMVAATIPGGNANLAWNAAQRAPRKRNPSNDYWRAPPADAHPAYKGSEHMDYEWWVAHYAPESVRAERRAKDAAAYALKYPPPTAAEVAQMRRDEADFGRKYGAAMRREAMEWRAPVIRAPGRKRNPSAIGQRVTVYFTGPMGSIGSKEGTLSAVDAHGVDFIPKGGRREHRIMTYYSPFILVVNGWGKAKPSRGMVPVASSTPGVTVSRSLYRSADPRWVSDFMRDIGNKYAPVALFEHGQLVSGGA